MALLSTDDQWPSLAPIRTTAISLYTHVADKETYQLAGGEQPYSHHDSGGKHRAAAANTPAPHAFSRNSSFSPKPAGCPNSSRPSDSGCCYTSPFSCTHLLPSCFGCVRPRRRTSASPRRRCTPTCMHKNKYALRSLAFLFPSAGKMQSFYSSTPTAKAQLSGAYPRTFSGNCMSPHTPGPTALTSQLSCRNSQFSSPRTPASSRVQHFSGAIPSPRTPYGPSLATSPASARRKKASFTLAMPPGVMDKKKAPEQVNDEPSSPHVTCIGRVRRQAHCKKLLRSDTIDLCTHRHQATIAKTKGTTILRLSSKHHSFPPTHRSNSAQSQPADSLATAEQPASILESCTQSFCKEKLLNLHKIQDDGNKTSSNVFVFEAEQMARANSGLGPDEETTLISDSGDYDVRVASQGSHIEKGTDLCMKNDSPLVNIEMNSSIDSTEYGAAVGRPPECRDADAVPTELPVQQITTSTTCMLESLDEDGELHEKPHHQAQRCLLLMRSTGSRRFSEADRVA